MTLDVCLGFACSLTYAVHLIAFVSNVVCICECVWLAEFTNVCDSIFYASFVVGFFRMVTTLIRNVFFHLTSYQNSRVSSSIIFVIINVFRQLKLRVYRRLLPTYKFLSTIYNRKCFFRHLFKITHNITFLYDD